MRNVLDKFGLGAIVREAEGAGGAPAAASPADTAAPDALNAAAAAAVEQKPDEGKAPEKTEEIAKGDEKGSKTDQEPEALTLKAPEGFEDYQAEFDNFAGDMDKWQKANPEATLKDALAEAARRQADLVKAQTTQATEAFNAQIDTWDKQARADKEFGGDDYQKNLSVAASAIKEFAPNLLPVLQESGLGSHPEMIRFAVKFGQMNLSEARISKAGQSSANLSLEDALYSKPQT